MKVRRLLLSGLVVPVAATLALSTAEAQVRSWWTGPGTSSFAVPWSGANPVAFEGYYSHYRLDTNGDERFGMNGVGARLMWRPTSADSVLAPSKVGLGVFGEYAPANDLGFSLLHLGVQGDLALTSHPWFGLTPVASLGAGMLHSNLEEATSTAMTLVPIGTRSTTTFALTPAAGVKVGLWRHVGLRGDMRDLITFRDGTRHNWQFTAGLSFPF